MPSYEELEKTSFDNGKDICGVCGKRMYFSQTSGMYSCKSCRWRQEAEAAHERMKIGFTSTFGKRIDDGR